MALAYLLCPTFQIENTAGKPATGGYLEVYVAGSRNKYYCASDFNGTLHPFRIELDSLGSNVVLADDSNAYDVYVYNRYGSLLMSRYGVKPGGGGGISSTTITSTDGSIVVTPTATGVDLRVDSEPPTSMRCSANDLQESDTFEFTEVQRNGADASVNNNGQVVVNSGWWHYDVVVRLKWPANPAENVTSSISLYSPNGASSSYFDRSYVHDETLQLSGEYKSVQDGTVFPVSIQGVPSGMTVELVDFGIHSVTGEGGGGGTYNGGEGILIDEADRVISIDPEVVQEKLTAGNNITIEDNVISAAAEPQVQSDWTQSDSTAVDYIQHKPDLSLYVTDSELDTILEGYATTTALSTGLAAKQDTISDLADIRAGAALGSTAVQPGDLATVATTGDYSDLSNTPTIPSGVQLVPSATSADADKVLTVDSLGIPGWAVVPSESTGLFEAVYGQTSYSAIAQAISDKKIVYCRISATGASRMAFLAYIGSSIVEFQYYRSLSSHSFSAQTDEVYVYTVSSSGWTTTSRKTGTKVVAGTHMSPSYIDGTLTLDAIVNQTYNGASTDAQSGVAVASALASKQDTISDLSDIRAGAALGATAIQPGDLATVATTGSYNDLLDKPTIPTVPVQDVEVNGASVVNAQGVAEITIDTGAFVAVYGTTTMAQVTAAYDAGKDIVCRYNDGHGRVYSGQLSSFAYGVYTFSTTDGFTEYDFTLSPNGADGAWSISSKAIPSVDSSYNASSYAAQSGVAVAQALSNYTPTASLSTVALTGDYDDLIDKPTIPVLPDTKDLVAGQNITITETSSTVTIAATAAPQLQANWNEADTSSVQYIQNKPTIPVLPSTKDLVAGNNISITEGTNDVTVACDITVGTVTI